MSARQSWPKRIALVVSSVMIATWSSLLIPGYALGAPNPGAGGNNGTVKICDVANGCPSSNDPHLNCPITIQWTGFDVAPAAGPQDTYDVTFSGISPTNGTVTANGAGNTDHGAFGGPDTSKQYSLQITNGTPNNKGEFHIGIDITTTTANGSDFKQKTVWVAGCASPADLSMQKTGTTTAAPGGAVSYTLTVTNVGGTATTGTTTVTDTLPAGINPGTMTTAAAGWSCPNATAGAAAQAPSCSTTNAIAPGASVTFTVSSTVNAATAPSPPVQTDTAVVSNAGDNNSANNTATLNTSVTGRTVSVTGSCDTTAKVYTWSVSTTPAGAVSGTWTKHGAASPNGAFSTTLPGGTGTFTTGSENDLDLAVSTTNWSLTSTHVTATSNSVCSPAAVTNPTASASATCSTLSATLNAGTNATVFTVNEPGGPHTVSLGANGVQTVNYGSSAGATITVTANSNQLASATAPANCGGGPTPTPASATATSTCSVASVHLDAGSTATDFTVTEPGGTHQVHVPANQTQDVTYTAGANVTISVSANGTVLSSATSPSSCGTPGQAQPDASASNACLTGITVVLSNMNGTAPATFTVTGPDGTTTTVPVNAGQLKKLDFAVAEDTTGVVTVSAPGLAKTFTYAKNCTKVLGEKHTVKPPKTPTKVLGEQKQLPFTGFNTKGMLFDASTLVALGAIVCALAMPRRRRFTPHTEV